MTDKVITRVLDAVKLRERVDLHDIAEETGISSAEASKWLGDLFKMGFLTRIKKRTFWGHPKFVYYPKENS